MPRNQANKNRPRAASRHQPQSRVPGWVWLFTGAVLGAFVMFLLKLADVQVSTSSHPGESSAKAPAETEGEQQPRFDFYNILKEHKVPVPQVEPRRKAEQAAPAEPEQYVLQVASFKGADDAESLRAELILLNLDAHVETAQVRNGETWYRVLVGPFESRSKLAKARSVLVSNRLEALVLKRSSRG